MVLWLRVREYRLSTAVEHWLRHTEVRCRSHNPSVPHDCSALLWTNMGEEKRDTIGCLGCYGGEEESYYKLHKQRFMTSLRSLYPDISDVCADKVGETFMAILVVGNASHRCPDRKIVRTFLCHDLMIAIQPGSGGPHATQAEAEAEEEIITKENFADEEGYDEEEFWPRPSPATRSSVAGLLKADPVAEEEDDCGICIEKMETSSSMRMPCSHGFHRLCLLEWLNNNHSCPICRHQLPAAQYGPKSDVPDAFAYLA